MNSLKHRFSILAAVIIFYDVFFQLASSILINSGASLYQNQFVAMGITGTLAVILSAMFLSSFPRVNVKYRRFNLWHFLFCVLLMYGLQYISNFIMSPLISFLKEHGYTMTQLEANSSGRIIDGPDFIYSVFLAPILEECFFRGLVYKMVRPSGVFASGIFLGLLFGLSHLNLIQFLLAFLIGILRHPGYVWTTVQHSAARYKQLSGNTPVQLRKLFHGCVLSWRIPDAWRNFTYSYIFHSSTAKAVSSRTNGT